MMFAVRQEGKPIDQWLGLGGIAAGIVFYLLPKTPLVVVSSLIIIFALLIHPIRNFWWIEAKLWRKLTATLLFVLALVCLGQSSWPPESGTLLQAVTHLVTGLWNWLMGIHGRWFDRSLGAGFAVAAIVVLALLTRMINVRRVSSKRQIEKGFLDYKLDAETALAAIPAIVSKLTTIIEEVAPAVNSHTQALKSASSTHQQLRVSREVSSSLDRYSARIDRVGVKFAEAGESLSTGLNGWFKWIEEARPSKAALSNFPEAMATLTRVLNKSNDQMRSYIAAVRTARGASSVLNAAVDRHIRSIDAILSTSIKIYTACSGTIRIVDSLS